MSFISSSYDEGETVIPTASETDYRLVQDLYDKVKGIKQMKIIDFFRNGNIIRLYYGEDDCNDYWGDDWDDAPYEHNAGGVYNEYIKGFVEFAFPLDFAIIEPCDGYFNSPFSKEDMKNRKVPCITISNGNKLNIYFEDDTDSTFKAIAGFGGVQLASYDNEENSVSYNREKNNED